MTDFSHYVNNEQHTAPYIIVISTKNEEKSITTEKDFSVPENSGQDVPPSKLQRESELVSGSYKILKLATKRSSLSYIL